MYESEWNNKFSYTTELFKLGDVVRQIIEDYELPDIYDRQVFDRLNSKEPYDIGTFGKGFYDMDFHDDEENGFGGYKGRIMIFEVE